MMIKHVSLKHGWFYFYRIHEPKFNDLLKEHSDLIKFMNFSFNECTKIRQEE